MALEFQVVGVNLGKGVNTKTDDKYSIPGELILLENAAFDKLGTLNKRRGEAAMATQTLSGTSLANTAARRLATLDKSLLLITKHTSFSGEDTNQIGSDYILRWGPNLNAWSKYVSAFGCQIETDAIFANTPGTQAQPENLDIAYLSGVLYYATAAGGLATIFAVDETTRAVLWMLQESSAPSVDGSVRLVVLGSQLFLIRQETTSNIYIREITNLSTNPAFGTKQLLINNLNTTSGYYDTAVGSSKIYLAYNGAVQIEVRSWNSSVITGSPGTPSPPVDTASLATEVADRCIAVQVIDTSSRVCVAWADASAMAIRSKMFSSSLGSVNIVVPHATTGGIVRAIAIAQGGIYLNGSAGSIAILWDEDYASQTFYNQIWLDAVSTNGVPLASPRMFCNSVTLASKIFRVGTGESTRYFVVAFYSSPAQSAKYLLELGNLAGASHNKNTVMGRAFYARGLPGSVRQSTLPSVVQGSSADANETSFYVPVLAYGIGNASVSAPFLHSMRMLFNPLSLFQSAEMAKAVHFPGGCVAMFDGAQFVEHNFLHYPEAISLADSVGGNLAATGTYSYVVVPEWLDNAGQRHQGPPSIPVNITLGVGNKTVTVTAPAIKLTNKKTLSATTTADYKFRVYRTQNLGSIYYDTGLTITPTLNTDTNNVVDDLADATIAVNETLYTTGGVVENIAPPPSSCIAAFNDRIFLGSEEGIFYSKKFVPGDPIQFSDAFVVPSDTLGGRPSALYPFNDKLLIFKRNSVHYLSGEGPADTGEGGGFSDPELLIRDLGTEEPNSVIETPDGIIFKTEKGFYLLDHALRISYIGAAVEYFNSNKVTSADLIKDKNQVRFLTSAGPTLVYDYFAKQWSTDPGRSGDDAIAWNDTYVRVSTTPRIEDSGFLLDGAAFALKLRTNWLTFNSIQGLQRIRKLIILGRFKSHHVLNVQFAYDYNPKVVNTIQLDTQAAGRSLSAIPESAIYEGTAFSGTDIYQFRVGLPRQKFESVQITIFDSNQAGTNESFSLTSLSFEVGLKRTATKPKAAFSQ